MRIAAVTGLTGLALLAAAPALAAVVPAEPAAPAAVTDITVTGHQASAPTPLAGGPDFISPMGKPFRSKDALSGAEHWFEQADSNGDGRLTREELRADADRFFNSLDTNHDGEIGPEEITRYETQIAPEVRVVSTYGDLSKATTDSDGKIVDPPYPTRLGAGRYGYLGMPEPVLSADRNFDLAVSRAEFEEAADRRFRMLDTRMAGAIVRAELPRLDRTPKGHRHR